MTMKTADREIPSASQKPIDASRAETTESVWKPLYRIGAVAGLIVVVLYVIQVIVLIVSPPPSTVIGYFMLFHKNALLGLLDLDLLSIADYALFVPLFLALSIALRRVSPSFIVIALALGLVGIATYFA